MGTKTNRMNLVVFGVVAMLIGGGTTRADFVVCDPRPVEEAINRLGTHDVQGCSFLHNGLKLYFSSKLPGNIESSNNREIWVAERESQDAPWGEAVNLGPNINGPGGAEQYPTISPDDLELYFRREGGWQSTRSSTDEPWGPATPYTGIYPDDFSPDGLTKYFSRSGDICMAMRETLDAPWSEPVNLGPNVNSSADQWGPSISNDECALFFCTSSPYRIWMSVRATTEDEWGPAVELGPAVNGYGWVIDPEISPNGSTLYFDSGARAGLSERFWQVSIKPMVDFTGDGMVDLDDLVCMIEYWDTDNSFYDIGPTAWGDGVVDEADLEVLMSYYGQVVDYTGKTVIDVKPPHNPHPANGWTTDVEKGLPLSWTPGDTVTVHDLYLGTDRAIVENANISDTSGVYRGEQTDNSYMPPEGVQAGQTYYWRLDEVRSEDIARKGEIWSFTVIDGLIVDNFESYTDEEGVGARIYETWIDGWFSGTSGAIVGYTQPPFAEVRIVHSGYQAMPFFYDNDGTILEGYAEYEKTGVPYYSETQRTWDDPQDWTREGVEILTLWFYGDPGNAIEPLYVALEDGAGNRKDITHPDPAALTMSDWQQWRIPLADFTDVDPTAIKIMSIGVGDPAATEPGGSGLVRIDDIELHRVSEQ